MQGFFGGTEAAICLAFPERLALLFGGSEELVAPAVGYLTIIAWGFPCQIFGATVDDLLGVLIAGGML